MATLIRISNARFNGYHVYLADRPPPSHFHSDDAFWVDVTTEIGNWWYRGRMGSGEPYADERWCDEDLALFKSLRELWDIPLRTGTKIEKQN